MSLKILHINLFDTLGGAARACYRIHKGLLKLGVYSRILVRNKLSRDDTVIGKITNKYAIPDIYSNKYLPYSIDYINSLGFDIINLHLIYPSVLCIRDIDKINAPIVWTLHTMEPFTGGCHHSCDCNNFITGCNTCINIKYLNNGTFYSDIFSDKLSAYKNTDITVVTPSKWLANKASNSLLLKDKFIKVIPNCLDTNTFKPANKEESRKLLNLPINKNILLFGATNALYNRYKGFNLLYEIFSKLNKRLLGNSELVIFGSDKLEYIENKPPIPIHYLGRIIDDDTLIKIYSAADVTLVPSINDVFCQVALESISCGTPVVCFNIGGNSEIIDHRMQGYIAEPFNFEDFAYGIFKILSEKERYDNICKTCRVKAVNNFDHKKVSRLYTKLYKQLSL